ncbi:FHA domain-containing protein [Nocardia uniformis]|uniref:FHA domain-containing protein n=1 Tax=Nocardia uniformis TaxID=53432 RepID=A0A849CD43_9NOCA|nr:FHA domain-containing protein [Nocardia uniformis]NNH74305.1 FHA domain-containing protein [Nocardia uniformis]
MGRIPSSVRLSRGEGLIARFGGVVLFLTGETPSTERILGAVEAAAGASDPGVAVAQRLAAAIFSSGSGQSPSFGVVAPTSEGLLVLLRGPVRAVIEGPEGAHELSGHRAMTWADEIIRDPVRRITVSGDGTANEVAHTDLRSGVVPGGGFVLHAPPTGIADRRRSAATPKTTAPLPPTDATAREPLPTPSHTRFTPTADSAPTPPRRTGNAARGTPRGGSSSDIPRSEAASRTPRSPAAPGNPLGGAGADMARIGPRDRTTPNPGSTFARRSAETSPNPERFGPGAPPGTEAMAQVEAQVEHPEADAAEYVPTERGPRTPGKTPEAAASGAPQKSRPGTSTVGTPGGRAVSKESHTATDDVSPEAGYPPAKPRAGTAGTATSGRGTGSKDPHAVSGDADSPPPTALFEKQSGTPTAPPGRSKRPAAEAQRTPKHPAAQPDTQQASNQPAAQRTPNHPATQRASNQPADQSGGRTVDSADSAVVSPAKVSPGGTRKPPTSPAEPPPTEAFDAEAAAREDVPAGPTPAAPSDAPEPPPTAAFDARAAALDNAESPDSEPHARRRKSPAGPAEDRRRESSKPRPRSSDKPGASSLDKPRAAPSNRSRPESPGEPRAESPEKPWAAPQAWSAVAGRAPVGGPPAPDTPRIAQPTGALTTTEGATYPLDRPYVIGRDPLTDDAVRRAAASPIVLAGNRHISRVHARISLDTARVFVQDAATPGGTFVAAPGIDDWKRLGPHRFELAPGWSVRIGDRILTYTTEPVRPHRY